LTTRSVLLTAFFHGVMGAGAEAGDPPPRLALIVHSSVPVQDLNLSDVRKIFLGDRQFWADDLRIVLLVPPARSPERAALLDRVYEKSEAQYRHYWIAKVFRAETHAAPKMAVSSQALGDLVRQIPGAIAAVDAAQVPAGVKVLRVDGRTALDAAYALR
jgi:hypothetical protein